MKVGIDLSSTNTGLVILSDDNKLIWHGNFKLWDSNRFVIADNVEKMIDTIRFKLLPQQKNMIIGVELADFKNANITNRFNLLTGMIITELNHWIIERIDLKLFNSNEWQQHLGLKPNMERQFRKDTARYFTKSNCLEYTENWTEDECDAYCIAYFLPQLRDRTQMHQEVKVKRVQAKKSKLAEKNEQIKKWRKENKLRQRQTKYLNILASGKKLTKAQDRALDNAIKELKEMENENHKR